jgi:DUF4097 and DUF4098 domain-containing protein YvlB
MPTFDTPTAIDVAIHLPVGAVEIIASDRKDTVVTVSPTNPDRPADVRGAEETKVTFDGTLLTIKGPKPRFNFVGPSESIDVTVEVPTGSRLTVDISMGGLRTSGRLGATRLKGSLGAVSVESTGDLSLNNSHGNVSVGVVDGSLDITASHGQIHVDSVAGDAILKASHGSVTVGDARGNLEAKLSYGDLTIGKSAGSVQAKTAYGAIQVGEVASGSVDVESGFGEVTVGVRQGVAAWLDLSSKKGHVRNELGADSAPEPSEQTVSVRARTQFGNIAIRRAK